MICRFQPLIFQGVYEKKAPLQSPHISHPNHPTNRKPPRTLVQSGRRLRHGAMKTDEWATWESACEANKKKLELRQMGGVSIPESLKIVFTNTNKYIWIYIYVYIWSIFGIGAFFCLLFFDIDMIYVFYVYIYINRSTSPWWFAVDSCRCVKQFFSMCMWYVDVCYVLM